MNTNAVDTSNTNQVSSTNQSGSLPAASKDYNLDYVLDMLTLSCSHLRDTLRRLQAVQVARGVNLQMNEFQTKMSAISNDNGVKKLSAAFGIGTGLVTAAAAGIGAYKCSDALSTVFSNASSAVTKSVDVATNGKEIQAQQEQALSDYQSGVAGQQMKTANDTEAQSRQASEQLLSAYSKYVELHQQLLSAVNMR